MDSNYRLLYFTRRIGSFDGDEDVGARVCKQSKSGNNIVVFSLELGFAYNYKHGFLLRTR